MAAILVGLLLAGYLVRHRPTGSVPPGGTSPPPVALVRSAADVGPLQEEGHGSGVVSARDGGGSAEVGGKLLWTFGDTFYTPARPFTAATPGADRYRSATSATSAMAAPLRLSTPIDALGAPAQLIPYSAEERAYNLATNDPGDRIALWPVAPVPLGDEAWIYYLRVQIRPPSKGPWTSTVGIARLRAGAGVAERSPDPLFSPDVPSFRSPLVQGSFVYLFDDCRDDGCRVARAPIYSADNAATYQAWDGQKWSPHMRSAAVVIPGSRTGVTVMWSGYAQRFIGAYIPYGSDRVMFVDAAAPQGPWTEPVQAFTGERAADGGDYAPYFHAELTASTSADIFLTYSRSLGGFRGDIRMSRLSLAPQRGAHPSSAMRIMPLGDSVTEGTAFQLRRLPDPPGAETGGGRVLPQLRGHAGQRGVGPGGQAVRCGEHARRPRCCCAPGCDRHRTCHAPMTSQRGLD